MDESLKVLGVEEETRDYQKGISSKNPRANKTNKAFVSPQLGCPFSIPIYYKYNSLSSLEKFLCVADGS